MTKEELLEKVKEEAEGYFERGEFFCSEAVVQTINNLLGNPYDNNIVKIASGFPIGMGKSGCLCGAVSGGQMDGRQFPKPWKKEALHWDNWKGCRMGCREINRRWASRGRRNSKVEKTTKRVDIIDQK